MSAIDSSAPSQRQITSAALSSDSRIIAVIRAVSYGVNCAPAAARVASRSAASQALIVDSVNITWADRASPIRRPLARSISVNEANPSAPPVTRRAAVCTVLYRSTGRGFGAGVAVAAGAASGAVAAVADGVGVGPGSAAGAASGTAAGSSLAPPGVPATASATSATKAASAVTVRLARANRAELRPEHAGGAMSPPRRGVAGLFRQYFVRRVKHPSGPAQVSVMRTVRTGRKDESPDGFPRLYRQGMSTPAETPLLRRIRESVIGDDQVDARPVRAAAGHLRRLHRLRAGARLHRGLHPRRGAPPLREHAHRVQRHRAADHPAARGRPPDHPRRGRRRRRHAGDLLRLRLRPARSTS